MNSQTWFNQIKEPILWHYTSQNVLDEFLKDNNCLYATRYSELNDSQEINFGRDVFNSAIKEFVQFKLAKMGEKRNWTDILRHSQYADVAKWTCFISSFTTKKDMVSLWNLYAPNGGYSIGFSTEILRESLNKFSALLPKPEKINVTSLCKTEIKYQTHFDYCSYDLQKMMDNCLDFVKKSLDSIYCNRAMNDSIELAIQLVDIRENLIGTFKHRSFSDESEVRISYFGPSLFQKMQRIGEKSRVPLFSIRDAIKEVIVSPYGDSCQLYSHAEILRKKYNLDFALYQSSSPYRKEIPTTTEVKYGSFCPFYKRRQSRNS